MGQICAMSHPLSDSLLDDPVCLHSLFIFGFRRHCCAFLRFFEPTDEQTKKKTINSIWENCNRTLQKKTLKNVSTNKPFVIQNLNLTVVKMLTEFHPTEIYNAHITPCAMYTVNRGMKKIIECCNLIKSMIQTRMMDDRWLNPFTFKMELKTLFFNYLLEETFSALFVNISTKCCINYFKKITLKLFNKFGIVSEIHEWKRAFFAFNNIKKSSLWMLNFCKKKQNWNSQLKIQMNGIQRDFLFNWFKCNKSNYFILLLNVFVFKELFRTIK